MLAVGKGSLHPVTSFLQTTHVFPICDPHAAPAKVGVPLREFVHARRGGLAAVDWWWPADIRVRCLPLEVI
jgi:hypothetical protein